MSEVSNILIFTDLVDILTLAYSNPDQPNRLTRPKGIQQLEAYLLDFLILPNIFILSLLLAHGMKVSEFEL